MIMKNPLIYLSGTIDGIPEQETKLWRNYVKLAYPEYRYHDPAKRIFKKFHPNAAEVVEPDKKEILESDIILVYYTRSSAGTLMEIMFSYEHKKPVILVNATGKEELSPWIRYHSTQVYMTIEYAMEYILEHYPIRSVLSFN